MKILRLHSFWTDPKENLNNMFYKNSIIIPLIIGGLWGLGVLGGGGEKMKSEIL